VTPGHQLVDVEGAEAGRAQRRRVVEQRLDAEEQRDAEQAQPVQQRVEHVGADLARSVTRLHRAPALQRADDGQHHGDLDQAHQQPAGGV
jgi:hypothetical protein